MKQVFEPWIGSKYKSEGLNGFKLLVLAESHYGEFGTEAGDFTQRTVRSQGRGERYRLFTVTAKLVLGRGRSYISDAERAAFWDRVAFANYIQSFVTETAKDRDRPTDEMWEEAAAPFLRTLDELEPDGLLVLGLELSRRLPQLPDDLTTCAIKHPARYLKYADWQPKVQNFLSATRAV